METKDALRKLLDDSLAGLGTDIRKNRDELAEYMAARAAHLQAIQGEPGYDQAVMAERNNVALEAGLNAHAAAGAVDSRLLDVLLGGIQVAALALA